MEKRFNDVRPTNTDSLTEGTTNLYFSSARTLANTLVGYAKSATSRALAVTDTILVALGVLEKKVDDATSSISSLTTTVNGKYTRPTTASFSLGFSANNPAGNANTFIGSQAGYYSSGGTGSGNTALGYSAAWFVKSGSNNNVIGYQAGYSLDSGNGNVFIGQSTGAQITYGGFNVIIGSAAGFNTGLGVTNTVTIGNGAGYSNNGNGSVLIGQNAGMYNNASNLVAIGNGTARNNSGNYNTFIGNTAGASNQTGYYNTFTGESSGNQNVSGANNTFFGVYSGYNTTTGSNNVAVGSTTGYNYYAGSNNTAIGVAAGSTKDLNNTVCLGYNAKATVSNSIIIGDTTNTDLKVGIGTQTPSTKLEVTGTISSTSGGFKFPDSTIQTTAYIPNSIILTSPSGNKFKIQVDDNGTLITTAV